MLPSCTCLFSCEDSMQRGGRGRPWLTASCAGMSWATAGWLGGGRVHGWGLQAMREGGIWRAWVGVSRSWRGVGRAQGTALGTLCLAPHI